MSYFAKVNNGFVVNVIRAEADFFNTFIDSSAGEWLQTSYNTYANSHTLGGTPLRKNFASIGYSYRADLDAFIPPNEYPSWTLNEELGIWESQVAYPSDGKIYSWNESTLAWDDIAAGISTPVESVI